MKAVYILLWPVLPGLVGANPIALEAAHPGSTTTAKVADQKPEAKSHTTETSATGTSPWRFQHSGDWVNIPCNGKDTDITKGTFMDKWNAAKVPSKLSLLV